MGSLVSCRAECGWWAERLEGLGEPSLSGPAEKDFLKEFKAVKKLTIHTTKDVQGIYGKLEELREPNGQLVLELKQLKVEVQSKKENPESGQSSHCGRVLKKIAKTTLDNTVHTSIDVIRQYHYFY